MSVAPYDGTVPVSLADRLDAANDSVNIGKINGTLPDAEFTILASGVHAATNSVDIVKPVGARGLIIWFDVTVVPTVDTVALSLIGHDLLTTGKFKTISAFTAQAGVGTFIYQVYPAVSLAGSFTQSSPNTLPVNIRVTITHVGVGNFTYAVGGCWIS
jgi:hypothetical protein